MKKIFTVFFITIFLFTIPKKSLNLDLVDSINNPHREQNSIRDKYRNPLETLKFFALHDSASSSAHVGVSIAEYLLANP